MAATHYGNCQICGKEHKVSGHTIAKHGFTLAHGWQEGACYGSGGRPIQVSCDLIEGGIKSAKAFIERCRVEIANPVAEDGTQFLVEQKQTRNGSKIVVSRITLRATEAGGVEAFYPGYHKDEIVRTWRRATLDEVRANVIYNRRTYLEARIAQSLENIAFMERIVADWKPSEMREIPEHERAGGKPATVHFSAFMYGVKNAPLCVGSASGAYRSRGPVTTDRAEVTCERCLKRLAERDERDARKAAQRAAQQAGE